MKHLVIILCLLSSAAWPQSMMVGVDRADAGASYVGPGNVVSGAKAWWGLRAYNGAYAASLGKIANICTPSTGTNVCADVFSDASGNFNLAGAGTLSCNNTSSICTIKTLYDQAGLLFCNSTACDITQATEATRPKLVVPGAANGCSTTAKFCMQFNNSELDNGSPFFPGGTAQPYTISLVYNNPATVGTETILSVNFATTAVVSINPGTPDMQCYAGTPVNIAIADNAYHAVQCVFNSPNSDTNIDGTANGSLSTGTNVLGGSTTIFGIGQIQGGGGSAFSGFLLEIGVWNNVAFSASPNSTGMSTNQHGYWGF